MTTLMRVDLGEASALTVSVQDAKAYLKIDQADTSQDSFIELLIRAGRDYGQKLQRRSWEERTITAQYLLNDDFIDLPYGPVVSVSELPEGATLIGDRLQLVTPFTGIFTVTYQAGTGASYAEKLALLKAVATAYENREDIAESGYTNLHQALDHLRTNRKIVF